MPLAGWYVHCCGRCARYTVGPGHEHADHDVHEHEHDDVHEHANVRGNTRLSVSSQVKA